MASRDEIVTATGDLVGAFVATHAPDERGTFELIGAAEVAAAGQGGDVLEDPRVGDAADLLYQIAIGIAAPMIHDAAKRGIQLTKPHLADALLPPLTREVERLRPLGPSRRLTVTSGLCAVLTTWRAAASPPA